MTRAIENRRLGVPELDELVALLEQSQLPVDDIDEAMLPAFRAIYSDDQLIAAGGVEPRAGCGLLRSVVVAREARGLGLGESMFETLESMARQQAIRELFLLTESAAPFFERHGYEPTERSAVPDAIGATRQFRELCPGSATCLSKRLSGAGPWPLYTSRLCLRAPRADDAEAIFERYASSAEIARWLGWPRHRDLADTREFLRFAADQWLRWPAGPLLIERRGDGRLLGSTGLAFDSAVQASTGFVLARDAWGRGYATEAVNALADRAKALGVTGLYAICHVDHERSAGVLERSGFRLAEIREAAMPFPNLDTDELEAIRIYAKGEIALD